ncbi:GtrA family protein [Kozakia baliensis]|uniref:Polysaccharide biosynthesis protein GtrA n=2 Tax=Kozakia baliensis TaxID=153496 RepID=A0A1D8UX16_9PROT|nr:GtrA family protein [Kozakia baliensis]AOX18156.1 polysaccharide biosynthesis protein GtrA [Kozakia baliensis]AOX21243.1 polysaccharide biosynthesis protein GtrA [Kozakia baliensis]
MGQFLRFAVVGGMGFAWDTGTVYLLRPALGLTMAILLAYFVAATINWVFNRLWTFRNVAQRGHLFLQWLHFLAANSLGFFLNRGTVYALCLSIPFCARYPVVPLAAGALAGMFANFNLSRRLVFRAKVPETPLELAQMTVEFSPEDSDRDLPR